MGTRLATLDSSDEPTQLATLLGLGTNLRKEPNTPLELFHDTLGNVENAPVDIFVPGDSLVEGFYADTIDNMWTSQVRDMLRSLYPSGAIGGHGRVASLNSVGSQSASMATVISGTNVQSYGLNRRALQMTGSGQGEDYVFTGDGVDLIWPQLTGTSGFSYAIDGGATTIVNSSGASVESGHFTSIRGLTPGTHTISIRWNAGTSVTEGIIPYYGDATKGVRMCNAGKSGEQLSERASASATWRRSIRMIDPALVIIPYGINDYRDNSQSPTLFKGYLETFIAQIRAECTRSPSFLLVAMYEPDHGGIPAHPWDEYCSAIQEVSALDLSCTFLDLRPLFGPRAGRGTSLVYGDQIHLQPDGHTVLANAVISAIV